jgi:hypothetical protein
MLQKSCISMKGCNISSKVMSDHPKVTSHHQRCKCLLIMLGRLQSSHTSSSSEMFHHKCNSLKLGHVVIKGEGAMTPQRGVLSSSCSSSSEKAQHPSRRYNSIMGVSCPLQGVQGHQEIPTSSRMVQIIIKIGECPQESWKESVVIIIMVRRSSPSWYIIIYVGSYHHTSWGTHFQNNIISMSCHIQGSLG